MPVITSTYLKRNPAPEQHPYNLLELAQGKGYGVHVQIDKINATAQIFVMCDPVTGDKVIVLIKFDLNNNLITSAYNLDGTPYLDPIQDLIDCGGSGGETFDITEGEPWCDGGTTIRPFTIWNVSTPPPVVVSTIWLDMTGVVIIPSGTQTPGACTGAIVTTPDFEGYNLTVTGGGTIGQLFTAPVSNVSIYNGSDDTISIVPTFTSAITGNGIFYCPKGGAEQFHLEGNTMTGIAITNIAGTNGGQIIINATT